MESKARPTSPHECGDADALPFRICVLVACHNRRQKTLASLAAVASQEIANEVSIQVLLVDDGSTDGTAEQVHAQFPNVRVLSGDGSLFWSGAMRRAVAEGLKLEYDAFLLLNDDTRLYPDAMRRLVETLNTVRTRAPDSIIVGSTCDPVSRRLSYGGLRRASRLVPLKLTKVHPEDVPTPCDTFNGNCVLIPREVMARVGNLDEAFTHGMGDFDLGFRAKKLNCALWVAPGYVGECELNEGKGLWTEEGVPVRNRWARLVGPKGLPPHEWWTFTRRHAGILWPLTWANPYLRFWFNALVGTTRQDSVANKQK